MRPSLNQGEGLFLSFWYSMLDSEFSLLYSPLQSNRKHTGAAMNEDTTTTNCSDAELDLRIQLFELILSIKEISPVDAARQTVDVLKMLRAA